ncbi:radical SAM protein [Candidatus Woesearchaeota archaeon]|nr:radical SAM protein [Candidatus Woesearchaeota archaeon]
MSYKASGINPAELGEAVLKRVYGTDKPFMDEPVLALYNIGRKIEHDPNWGLCYVSDVLICNYSCAHCWVSIYARNGILESDFMRKKPQKFVSNFRGKIIHPADTIFDYLEKKSGDVRKKIFAFTGGETLFHRAGLKVMGELAKQAARETGKKIIIGIDTNGWLIAEHKDYLDAWEGLQDVMSLYVSIKGTEPKEFQRFTGVDGRYYDYPFIALERLLKRGFFAIPGGIVLNTFADKHSLEHKINPVTRLHERLSAIHPELPCTISYHAVSMRAHDPKALSRRMKSRGYEKTTPSLVKESLINYFNKQGSPILEHLPENKGIPGIVLKDKTLTEIIASFK